MTYYIRAKSYYRYAWDLFKNLVQFKKTEEFQKKAKEVFNLGLKAIWAISYVNPPEKPPEFKELWEKAIETLEPEDLSEVEKIKNMIFSEKIVKEELIENLRKFLEIIKKVLKPIL